MVFLLIGSWVLLGVASSITQFKEENRLSNFLHLLFFVASGLVVMEQSDDSYVLVLTLFTILSLNIILSKIAPFLLTKRLIRLIPAIISSLLIILLFRNSVITINGDATAIINKFVILGMVVAVFSYDLGSIKLKVFNNAFGGLSDDSIMRSLMLFMVAVSFYLGMIGASFIGVFIIAAVYLTASFCREEDTNYFAVSMLNMVLVGLLLSGIELFALSPDVGFGIFFGAFSIYFLSQLDKVERKTAGAISLAYFVTLLIVVAIWFAGNLFEPMGGIDAVAAILIGLALSNGLRGKNVLSIGMSSMVVSSILLLSEFREQDVVKEQMEEVSVMGEVETVQSFISLDDLIKHEYTINPDSSMINFELGKRRETKGVFKRLNGSFVFGDDLNDVKCNVVLKLDDFSTRNSMRDEELMGDSYFSKEKYPEMVFTSGSISQIDALDYELSGVFTMLGKAMEQKVKLRRLESDGTVQLIVEGIIDRTRFGMTPSATEGNVVYFTGTVFLDRIDQK